MNRNLHSFAVEPLPPPEPVGASEQPYAPQLQHQYQPQYQSTTAAAPPPPPPPPPPPLSPSVPPMAIIQYDSMSFPTEASFVAFPNEHYNKFLAVVGAFSGECVQFHARFSKGPLEFEPAPLIPLPDRLTAQQQHQQLYDFEYEQYALKQVGQRQQQATIGHFAHDLFAETVSTADALIYSQEASERRHITGAAERGALLCGIPLTRLEQQAESSARRDVTQEEFACFSELVKEEIIDKRIMTVAVAKSGEFLQVALSEKETSYGVTRAEFEEKFSIFVSRVLEISEQEKQRADNKRSNYSAIMSGYGGGGGNNNNMVMADNRSRSSAPPSSTLVQPLYSSSSTTGGGGGQYYQQPQQQAVPAGYSRPPPQGYGPPQQQQQQLHQPYPQQPGGYQQQQQQQQPQHRQGQPTSGAPSGYNGGGGGNYQYVPPHHQQQQQQPSHQYHQQPQPLYSGGGGAAPGQPRQPQQYQQNPPYQSRTGQYGPPPGPQPGPPPQQQQQQQQRRSYAPCARRGCPCDSWDGNPMSYCSNTCHAGHVCRARTHVAQQQQQQQAPPPPPPPPLSSSQQQQHQQPHQQAAPPATTAAPPKQEEKSGWAKLRDFVSFK